LGFVATLRPDELQLFGSLHAHSNGAKAERVGDPGDGLHHLSGPGFLLNALYERAIDLQTVDGQPRKFGQVRVTSELVDCDVHAKRLQLRQSFDCLVRVLEQHGDGQLQLDAVCLKLGDAQGSLNLLQEASA
jgi:hypothetical protein